MGSSLQTMDTNRAAIMDLLLRPEGFESYRCDGTLSMGMHLNCVAKILSYAGDDDIITIKAEDFPDTVTFMFESPNLGGVADFQMKLMNIYSEHVGIPDAEYQFIIRMPSAEFMRICKVLSNIGDNVTVSVTKESVKFSTAGEVRTANVVCQNKTVIDKPEESTILEAKEPVSRTSAPRYMNSFTMATPLSNTVTISLSSKQTVVVGAYKIGEM